MEKGRLQNHEVLQQPLCKIRKLFALLDGLLVSRRRIVFHRLVGYEPSGLSGFVHSSHDAASFLDFQGIGHRLLTFSKQMLQ